MRKQIICSRRLRLTQSSMQFSLFLFTFSSISRERRIKKLLMNEFELIQRLTRSLPTNKSVVVGPGDDCAVLDFGLPDRLLLFKTDAIVEGIHFPPDTPPEKIGHKALGRCLSDIAAKACFVPARRSATQFL